MTEKEKMEHQKLYDANYDKELAEERLRCKRLCQIYNNLPVENIEERHELIKTIIGKTGKNIRSGYYLERFLHGCGRGV